MPRPAEKREPAGEVVAPVLSNLVAPQSSMASALVGLTGGHFCPHRMSWARRRWSRRLASISRRSIALSRDSGSC